MRISGDDNFRSRRRGRLQSNRPRCAEFSVFAAADRKSTRLNSSHVRISYAVFCLKKKIIEKMFSQIHITYASFNFTNERTINQQVTSINRAMDIMKDTKDWMSASAQTIDDERSTA